MWNKNLCMVLGLLLSPYAGAEVLYATLPLYSSFAEGKLSEDDLKTLDSLNVIQDQSVYRVFLHSRKRSENASVSVHMDETVNDSQATIKSSLEVLLGTAFNRNWQKAELAVQELNETRPKDSAALALWEKRMKRYEDIVERLFASASASASAVPPETVALEQSKIARALSVHGIQAPTPGEGYFAALNTALNELNAKNAAQLNLSFDLAYEPEELNALNRFRQSRTELSVEPIAYKALSSQLPALQQSRPVFLRVITDQQSDTLNLSLELGYAGQQILKKKRGRIILPLQVSGTIFANDPSLEAETFPWSGNFCVEFVNTKLQFCEL
jgi:hypothetical protein